MGGPEDDLVAALDALHKNDQLRDEEKSRAAEVRDRLILGEVREEDAAWIAAVAERAYEQALADEMWRRQLDFEDYPDGWPS